MLSNSIAAGCLATAYVLILFLQLNPALPLDPARLAPLATTVGLFYVVNLTVVCYVAVVVHQLLAREVFSPAWLSVGVLAWLGALVSAAGAALTWANLSTFGRVLDAPTVTAMIDGTATLASASLGFLLLAWARRAAGAQRLVLAFLLLAIAAASVAVPIAARGAGSLAPLEARPIDTPVDFTSGEPAPRVQLIALDAGSLDFIVNATADGRLPNFGRILDSGAVMHLATIHPTSAEAVWAAVVTGKLPLKNGVRSAGMYRFAGGDVVELLPNYCFAYGSCGSDFSVRNRIRRRRCSTRALWSMLSTHGVSVGAVAWPLTQPAPAVRGYVVSDAYLRLARPRRASWMPRACIRPKSRLTWRGPWGSRLSTLMRRPRRAASRGQGTRVPAARSDL